MIEEIDEFIKVVDMQYSTEYFLGAEDCTPPTAHAHPFFELFIMLEGDVRYTVDDRAFDLKSTQLIIVPPSHEHSIEKNERHKAGALVRGLTFQFEIRKDKKLLPLFAMLNTPQTLQLNSIPEMITLIHTVSHHHTLFSKEEFFLLRKTYLIQLLLLLYKFSYVNLNIDKPLNHLTIHVLAYINQHLTEKINVKSIATTLKFTESYITKTFKKDMQLSIMQYIKERRLRLAESLIFGGEKPIQAMYKSGFSDYSNFFKEFTKIYGITPKQMWTKYRKEAPQFTET